MPRAPRIQYRGACYHVMCRGDHRERIYQSDGDCELFLSTLGEASEKTGWIIHAYVLMGNHYHLLLETPQANLVAGMQWFQGTYTKRYNTRYRLSGHLFQGRYKALVIDADEPEYFETVASYIHLNPARSKITGPELPALLAYKWSSFRYYIKSGRRPEWLAVDRVLACSQVSDDPRGRKKYKDHLERRFREIVKTGPDENAAKQWGRIRRGWVLGSEGFKAEMLKHLPEILKNKKKSSYTGWAKRDHDEAEAERLLKRGLKSLNLHPSKLLQMPKGAPEKKALAWILKRRTVVPNEWVATQLHAGHPANIPGYVKEIENNKTRAAAKLKHILKSED